eukprot:gene878-9789_t
MAEFETVAISWIVRIGGITSIIGGLFVILNYLLFSQLRRSSTHKILFLQGISDLTLGLIYGVIGTHIRKHSIIVCQFQGYLSSYFDLFSSILPCILITQMFMIIIGLKKFMRNIITVLSIIIAYLFPLTITIIVFFTEEIDQILDGWCWLTNQRTRLLLFYVPIWVFMGYVLLVYILIGIYLTFHSCFLKTTSPLDNADWSIHSQRIKENNWKIMRNFSIFPLIFIISYSFATAKRIYDFYTSDTDYLFWLSILTAIGTQSRGFFNGIAYAITQNIYQLYMDKIKSCYSFCFPNGSPSEKKRIGRSFSKSNPYSYITYFTETEETEEGGTHSTRSSIRSQIDDVYHNIPLTDDYDEDVVV